MSKRNNCISLSLLAIVILVAGCGQKGDLYIPPPQPEVPVTAEPKKEDQ